MQHNARFFPPIYFFIAYQIGGDFNMVIWEDDKSGRKILYPWVHGKEMLVSPQITLKKKSLEVGG